MELYRYDRYLVIYDRQSERVLIYTWPGEVDKEGSKVYCISEVLLSTLKNWIRAIDKKGNSEYFQDVSQVERFLTSM
jgi:hypothetical protein